MQTIDVKATCKLYLLLLSAMERKMVSLSSNKIQILSRYYFVCLFVFFCLIIHHQGLDFWIVKNCHFSLFGSFRTRFLILTLILLFTHCEHGQSNFIEHTWTFVQTCLHKQRYCRACMSLLASFDHIKFIGCHTFGA